jgi:hypothetical protein
MLISPKESQPAVFCGCSRYAMFRGGLEAVTHPYVGFSLAFAAWLKAGWSARAFELLR